jgi:RNA methyltransferase, TrmH family
MMITSASNPKLRYVRHLERRAFRRREGRMRLEGVRLVEEALAAGCLPHFVLVAGSLGCTERGAALRDRLHEAGVPVLVVAEDVFAAVADTVNPQGILAVVPIPDLALPAAPRLVLIADGVRDPGNLGAILRTADAAGADACLAAPGTADPTAPKVVRAAMGAHFRVPIARLPWDGIARVVTSAGLPVWVADADGVADYADVDWARGAALVIGGEAEGPTPAALALGTTVRVPMPGGAESLNAAAAAAVLLFEAVRGRRGRTADRISDG